MRLLLLFIVTMCLGLGTARAGTPVKRVDQSFNDGWRMAVGEITGAERIDFDDATWKPVTLPRAHNEDQAFKVDIHDLKGAVIWYRKRFILPADIGPAVGGKAIRPPQPPRAQLLPQA